MTMNNQQDPIDNEECNDEQIMLVKRPPEAVPPEAVADVPGAEGEEAPDGDEREQEEIPPVQADEASVSPLDNFTATDAVEEKPNVSIREILGGDILTAEWMRRQMGVILLCAVFAIIYITNRYMSQQEVIEIEKLKVDLNEVRYRALTRSSELTVRTRQSQVEEILSSTADSVLAAPKEPPFIINLNPDAEE